ncbi:hypothetical protein C7E12_09875, partial [Stenotrophomonas maltophilia]
MAALRSRSPRPYRACSPGTPPTNALARFYAGQVYDRWLLDSAMSLSELVTVQDGRA